MAELGKSRRWRTALAMALWGIGSGAGAASGPDPFPFVAGDRWTWEVIQSTGAGSRILGHTHDPATSELIETWQLEIGERDADGSHRATWTRTPSSGTPANIEQFTLARGPDGVVRFDAGQGARAAFTFDALPNPVSVENVPCVAHLFGDVPGVCTLAPDGPLAIAPGPTHMVLSAESRQAGRALVQWMVGLSSAGTFIPGNRATRKTATLVAYRTGRPEPPVPDALLQWQHDRDLAQLKRFGTLDAETAAAILAITDTAQLDEVAVAITSLLSPQDRFPALRVALRRAPGVGEALVTLARTAAVAPLGDDAELIASVRALFPEEEHEAVAALLRGRWPAFAATLLAPAHARVDAAVAQLSAGMPSLNEVRAVLRSLRATHPESMVKVVPAAVRALPAADADSVMLEVLADSSLFDARFDLLRAAPEWRSRQLADPAATGRLLETLAFDNERHEVFNILFAQASHQRRLSLLVQGVEAMDFDDERLNLLRRRSDLVAELLPAQRRQCLAAFGVESAAAARILKIQP